MMKFNRRQFFVKKEFQGKFILLYALTVILILSATTYVLNARLTDAVNALFFSSHLKVHNTSEFVYSELLQVNLMVILALGVGTIGVSLVIFRRLNAHFQRIEHVFEEMAKGRYSPEALPASRFNEISAFNDLVDDVKGAWSDRNERLALIAARLRQALENKSGQGELEALHHQLEALLGEIRLPEKDEEGA